MKKTLTELQDLINDITKLKKNYQTTQYHLRFCDEYANELNKFQKALDYLTIKRDNMSCVINFNHSSLTGFCFTHKDKK